MCNGVNSLYGNSIYCLFLKPDELCITMYIAMLLSLRDQIQSEKLLLLHQWHLLLSLPMMPIKREEMLDLDPMDGLQLDMELNLFLGLGQRKIDVG